MEKQVSYNEIANCILTILEEHSKIGFETTPYLMAWECIEYYEDRDDLSNKDRCTIMAIACDLMDHLKQEGYFKTDMGKFKQIKPVENLEVGCKIVETSFKFDLSEKLEK